MKENYHDIKSRIDEAPTWYDQNGAPRYGEFTPDRCPNVYTNFAALVRIACQYCQKEFIVQMHAEIFGARNELPPSKWHYSDPPIHVCVGDTMNCDDLEVLQAWQMTDDGWERMFELEGPID